MCPPLMAAALIMTAATSAMQYSSEQNQADYQSKLNSQNSAAITANRVSEQTQVQNQEQSDNLTAYQKEDQQARQTRAASATSATAAGEAGVSGVSIDALQQEYFGNMGRFDADVQTNRSNDESRLQLQSKSIGASTASQQNNLPPVQDPSLLATGLQIGGGALGDYSQFGPKANTSDATASSQPEWAGIGKMF